MESVPELLLKWGLDGTVIQAFIDNDVTLQSLKFFKKDTIKTLIPKCGPRDLFEEHFQIYKESLAAESIAESSDINEVARTPEAGDGASVVFSVPEAGKTAHLVSSANGSEEEPGSSNLKRKSEECAAAGSSKVSKTLLSIKKDEPFINGLHDTLKSTTEGVILLSHYNNFQTFEEHHMDELATRAIYGELKNNYEIRISTSRHLELAKEIVELFPSQSANSYCLVSKAKNKTTVSGKLRSTLYNIRRKLIKCGLISKSKLTEELLSEDLLDSERVDDDDNILWLKAHDRPWVTVLEKWETTYELRKIIRGKLEITKYIKFFPALKSSVGYELLVSDFEDQSPSSKGRISTHWPQYLNFLKEQLLRKLPKLFTDIPEGQHTTLILLNFAELFKIRSLPKLIKSKEVWRPSRPEVQQTFIFQLNDIKELDKIIETRQEVLQKFGFSFQPFAVIIGDLDDIRQCLVILEKQRWPVPSPLEAIDICYKDNGALNALYPPESRHLWLCMQRNVYGLETRVDFDKDTALKSFVASHLKNFSLFLQKLP